MSEALKLVLEHSPDLPLIKCLRLVSKSFYNHAINRLYTRFDLKKVLCTKYTDPHQNIYLINHTCKEFLLVARYKIPLMLIFLLTRRKDLANEVPRTKKVGGKTRQKKRNQKLISRWRFNDKIAVSSRLSRRLDIYNTILYL